MADPTQNQPRPQPQAGPGVDVVPVFNFDHEHRLIHHRFTHAGGWDHNIYVVLNSGRIEELPGWLFGVILRLIASYRDNNDRKNPDHVGSPLDPNTMYQDLRTEQLQRWMHVEIPTEIIQAIDRDFVHYAADLREAWLTQVIQMPDNTGQIPERWRMCQNPNHDSDSVAAVPEADRLEQQRQRTLCGDDAVDSYRSSPPPDPTQTREQQKAVLRERLGRPSDYQQRRERLQDQQQSQSTAEGYGLVPGLPPDERQRRLNHLRQDRAHLIAVMGSGRIVPSTIDPRLLTRDLDSSPTVQRRSASPQGIPSPTIEQRAPSGSAFTQRQQLLQEQQSSSSPATNDSNNISDDFYDPYNTYVVPTQQDRPYDGDPYQNVLPLLSDTDDDPQQEDPHIPQPRLNNNFVDQNGTMSDPHHTVATFANDEDFLNLRNQRRIITIDEVDLAQVTNRLASAERPVSRKQLAATQTGSQNQIQQRPQQAQPQSQPRPQPRRVRQPVPQLPQLPQQLPFPVPLPPLAGSSTPNFRGTLTPALTSPAPMTGSRRSARLLARDQTPQGPAPTPTRPPTPPPVLTLPLRRGGCVPHIGSNGIVLPTAAKFPNHPPTLNASSTPQDIAYFRSIWTPGQHVPDEVPGHTFRCRFCGKCVGKKRDMRRHCRKYHPDEDVDMNSELPVRGRRVGRGGWVLEVDEDGVENNGDEDEDDDEN